MVDILGELRHFAKGGAGDVSAACSDAAAEIVRLRSRRMGADQARQQVEFIRNELVSGAEGGIIDSNTLHGLLFHALRSVEAEAENARLRTALERIANDDRNCADHCRRRAKRTLEQQEPAK